MRDPFESSPALRLGDAKAKPREMLREPRPPSLAPEFGDAFGAAFSKPRTYSFADVDLCIVGVDMGSGVDETGIEILGGNPMVPVAFGSFFDEAANISRETLAALLGNVAHETLAALLGNVAHETRGARVDDVTITSVVRKPVGDGAMRYKPRGFVEIPLGYHYVEGKLYPDLLIEKMGLTPDRPPIDYGDTSPAALFSNHAALVAKKDAEK